MSGRVALAAAAALLLGTPARAQDPSAPTLVHVDAREGSDKDGDGSAEKPFRSLYRALRLLALVPERKGEIHVEAGHYSKADGESMPLHLPAGVRIVGVNARWCEIAGEEGTAVFELPARGEVALEGVTLQSGSAALALAASRETDARISLVDVATRNCDVGLDLTAAAGGKVAVRGEGLRFSDGTTGISARGAATLDLSLARSILRRFQDGVLVSTEGAAGDGVEQHVRASACRFQECKSAGVRRHGDARERSPSPWIFEECLFDGDGVGLQLEIPGGDTPLLVRDCRFLENELFGLLLVGSGAALDPPVRVLDSLFRWNGVGLQLLANGRPVELSNCRIEDSCGNGIFCGNLTGVQSVLRLEACTLAANANCGIFAMCEVKDGLKVAVDRCTIADNGGSGIMRTARSGGSGTLDVARSIVAGNRRKDLVRLKEGEVHDCFVADGSAGEHGNNRSGDPRFVDARARDFHLAADSPARDEHGELGACGPAARAGSAGRSEGH